MLKNVVWIGLALSLLGFVSASNALADETDKKTVLTFSQPFEIPGHVLPAGTYTFKLLDATTDRHIVQVFNADGSQIIATVMAIPNSRLKSTDQTVIRFTEMPAGTPEAIRAWFYPGNTIGQEFVYPKARATYLAMASKTAVPAIATDVASIDDLRTMPIVSVTPDRKEIALNTASQTTPSRNTANNSAAVPTTTGRSARLETTRLPKTASTLPLIVLFSVASIGLACGLMAFGKREAESAAE